MKWGTSASCFVCLGIGLGVGVLLPVGNGGRDSDRGAKARASYLSSSPTARPTLGGSFELAEGKIARFDGKSSEPFSSAGEDGGVMVSASILSELGLPGSVSSLDQDLVGGDGKIEDYLGVSEVEKVDLERLWQDARQQVREAEAAASVSEELDDGSVKIVRPVLTQAMQGAGSAFDSTVRDLLGEERGEAFLSLKGAGAAFDPPEAECIYTVAAEETGDGGWRFRMTLEEAGERRVWIGAAIPEEIRHLTDAAGVVSSLELAEDQP